MAKKKKKGNTKQKPQIKTQTVKTVSDQELSDNLDNKLDEIVNQNEITDTEIKENVINDAKNPEVTTFKSAQDLFHKALGIEKVLEKRKNEYERLKDRVENDKTLLEKEKSKNENLKSELKEKLDKYNEELTEINQLRVDGSWASVIDKKLLDNYEDQLKKQEEILIDKITELNKKHSVYISALSDLESKKLDQETEFQQKLNVEKEKLKTHYQEKFNSKEKELDSLSINLEEKKKLLEKKQKQLNYEVEDFEDDKKFLTDKARKKVEQETEELNQQIQNIKEKNNFLNIEYKNIKDELKYLGDYKAKDIIIELRSKERELFNLREKLETSPDILKIDELKRLQKEKNDWQNKLRESDSQLNEYKSRYENQKLQIGEKERLEFQKEELEQRIKLQQSALEELKEEVSELTRQTEDKITFVSCSEMDINFKEVDNNLSIINIYRNWIEDIQHSIARVTNEDLYYDLNTIRTFISGLAMSRFSILQGISGTGKTSLPKAFANAVGGNYGIVAVQSGWKDKQDLIGYYNTFEKKYYEGDFLKYLYKAQTPKYRDKPFFIILDEMNLSHPEHYFADILSLMEETEIEKQILPISDKIKDIPNEMILNKEGGIGIKIPNNVWFIGTANHDETTLQFAPKTYDRANILEMPINIEQFEIDNEIDFDAVKIQNKSLLQYFNEKRSDPSIHSKVSKYLNLGNFKELCNKFGIGWGNRLDKQIRLFTPIFIALEGSCSDAIDHIIASKILRPIKGRYDLQETTLNEMKDELEQNFKNVFGGVAEKSLKIINEELSRLE